MRFFKINSVSLNETATLRVVVLFFYFFKEVGSSEGHGWWVLAALVWVIIGKRGVLVEGAWVRVEAHHTNVVIIHGDRIAGFIRSLLIIIIRVTADFPLPFRTRLAKSHVVVHPTKCSSHDGIIL